MQQREGTQIRWNQKDHIYFTPDFLKGACGRPGYMQPYSSRQWDGSLKPTLRRNFSQEDTDIIEDLVGGGEEVIAIHGCNI